MPLQTLKHSGDETQTHPKNLIFPFLRGSGIKLLLEDI